MSGQPPPDTRRSHDSVASRAPSTSAPAEGDPRKRGRIKLVWTRGGKLRAMGPERCSAKARSWVHAYAAGAAAYAFVPIPIPGSTTAGLVALESTMVHAIARIYGVEISLRDAAAIVTGLEVTGGALKTVAREATALLPGFGWMLRAGLAAGGIEAIGNAVIAIFERRHPGKVCAGQ